MESHSADVVVVGAGPAGWSLAHACSTRGLDTIVVAHRPEEVWSRTLGLWDDERAALPPGSRTVRAPTVRAAGRPVLRGYAVLDNASVLAAFREGGASTVAGTVTHARADGSRMVVHLRGGRRLVTGVVVDASGDRSVLSAGRGPAPRAEQTAYGVIVPADAAAPLVGPGEAVFMEWARDGGDAWPTFLYAVPLTGGRVLLEETSLARRPGLPLTDLAVRLRARLASAGVPAEVGSGTEKVRFALDQPVPAACPGVLAFGVAGGMMHPATGFSVGDAIAAAPQVAEALLGALPGGAYAAAAAARAALWPPRARIVRRVRDAGLQTLLRLPPTAVPAFFDAFFALPIELQTAYLSGRSDPAGTVAAMAGVFARAPWGVRGAMLTAQLPRLGPNAPAAGAPGSTLGC